MSSDVRNGFIVLVVLFVVAFGGLRLIVFIVKNIFGLNNLKKKETHMNNAHIPIVGFNKIEEPECVILDEEPITPPPYISNNSQTNEQTTNIDKVLVVQPETIEPAIPPNIELSKEEIILNDINGGHNTSYWMKRTNPKIGELLFEWKDNQDTLQYELYYKSFRCKGNNYAPLFTSYNGKRYKIEKDSEIYIFKTALFGYAKIVAPIDGIVNSLKYEDTFTQLEDNSIVLYIEYSEDAINVYKQEQEKKENERKRLKEEQEKEQIKRRLIEKANRRKLEKLAMQELTDEGILFPDQNKRERIPKEVVDTIWNRDAGRCVYCGSQENIHIDHIIPFSKGGSSSIENLQLLCQKCNLTKSNKIG